MAVVTATATPPMPPGPALPRLLQTLGFILVPARFIDACRRRYGDVVTFSSLFDSGFVMVFEPELVKQVFRGSPEVLRAGEANAVLGPVVGDRSVLLLDGAKHLRERKLMLPAFHGERMRAYAEVIREATDNAIESWPVGEPFTVLPQMQSLTLDVIVRAVFGVDAGPRQEELKGRIRALLDPVSSRVSVLMLALSRGRLGAGAGRRLKESRRVLDELIYEEIARRRAAEDLEQREDVLSMLLLARDEGGRSMTDPELRDELVTLLVAGHETTATGLAWAFELLLRTPRVLERLRADLAEGGRLSRGGGQGDPATAPGDHGRWPRGPRGALPAGRLPDPDGGRDQPVDRDDPPSRGPLPGRARISPRALPRPRCARHLHLAALRWRHASLPRRQLRHVRDAGRRPPGPGADPPGGGGAPPGKGRASRDHIRSCRRRSGPAGLASGGRLRTHGVRRRHACLAAVSERAPTVRCQDWTSS